MTGIELYATGDGAKALAACRPSRCLSRGPSIELHRYGGKYAWCAMDDQGQYTDPKEWLSDHSALAVIRDHFRMKLAKRGVYIGMRHRGYEVANVDGQRLRKDGRFLHGADEADYFATYDEAMIAAILAWFGNHITNQGQTKEYP